MTGVRRRAVFLSAAKGDVGRLAEEDPAVARLALRTIRDLEVGSIEGRPLQALAKSGDLSDCRKVYFGAGSPPSHRIVYRVDDEDIGTVEILEVVAVEARSELYVYLLAAARLGRLPMETKPEFDRLHHKVIALRAAKRKRR